jgi:hypothetical protein
LSSFGALKAKDGTKMVEGNKELKIKILEFFNLLESVPDEPSSSTNFISFLRGFLRVRSESPLPTIEVMTVLKNSKPIVYTTLRNASNKYEMLQFLMELSMEENEANNNLKSFLI